MKSLRNKAYQLLRKSESFFKTDVVYLVKGGFWLISGHGFSLAAGLILTIGFANLISPDTFGTYKFILSATGILTAFSLTGLPSALTRSAARGFNTPLKSICLENLKWSFLVFIGGLVTAIYYFLNENSTLAIGMLIAGSFSPFISSTSLYAAFLEGKKDFRKNTFYGMVRNIAPIISLLLTIYLTDNPVAIILVYFVANTLINTALFLRIAMRQETTKDTDESLLSYSKHLSLMEIIGRIGSHIDKVLVFHFLGPAQLAIYTFAIAPVDQIQTVKKFLRTLAIPKFSSRTLSELQESMPRKSFLVLLFSTAIALVYVLLAPLFYRIVFPQYTEAIVLSQIYALVLLLTPNILFTEALVSHQKTAELYIIKTVAPIIKIALIVVLIPLYGLVGLIVALILGKLLGLIMTVYLFNKASI